MGVQSPSTLPTEAIEIIRKEGLSFPVRAPCVRKLLLMQALRGFREPCGFMNTISLLFVFNNPLPILLHIQGICCERTPPSRI